MGYVGGSYCYNISVLLITSWLIKKFYTGSSIEKE